MSNFPGSVDRQLAAIKHKIALYGPGPHPLTELWTRHELRLTGACGRGGLLVVRCTCMAQTRRKPRPRFSAYDPIGTAASLPEALGMYRAHLDSAGAA